MSRKILGKKILFVTAHPDDEAFLASGTCMKNYQAGGQNWLLCATCGERGRAHVVHDTTLTQLKKIRRRELVKVSRFLHVRKLKILELPDCCLSDHQGQLFKQVLAFAQELKPEVLISFGPDGVSGHEDHVVVGEVAAKVAKQIKTPFLAFVLPPRLHSTANLWLAKRQKHGVYHKTIRYRKPDIRVPIDGKVKIKALSYHRSQLEAGKPFRGFPALAAAEYKKAEYFLSQK